MMKIPSLFARAAVVAAVLFATMPVARAGTILKLSLGDDAAADVEYTGGVLSTVDDGMVSPGDQNTAVEFLDFLSSIPNIPSADASYTLDGVTATGSAVLIGGTVLQAFTGGTFELWDDTGTLLLGVALGGSQLSANLGAPANGAVFSTTFGSPLPGPAGGTLAPLIVPGTVSMSIAMGNINGGAGLTLSPPFVPLPPLTFATLDPFTANVTKTIDAERIPEPTAALLLLLGGLMAAPLMRRRA